MIAVNSFEKCNFKLSKVKGGGPKILKIHFRDLSWPRAKGPTSGQFFGRVSSFWDPDPLAPASDHICPFPPKQTQKSEAENELEILISIQ